MISFQIRNKWKIKDAKEKYQERSKYNDRSKRSPLPATIIFKFENW